MDFALGVTFACAILFPTFLFISVDILCIQDNARFRWRGKEIEEKFEKFEHFWG